MAKCSSKAVMMSMNVWKVTLVLVGAMLLLSITRNGGRLLIEHQTAIISETASAPKTTSQTPDLVRIDDVWGTPRGNTGAFLGNGRLSPKFSKLSLLEAEVLIHHKMTKRDYKCLEVKRFGRRGDGGYDLCLDPPYKMKTKSCIVYSFGISSDWSFDEAINKEYGCEIHSFDPSIGLKDHTHKEPNMFFHNLGLWGSNTRNEQGWQMKDLATIITDLGHTNKSIDYLKVDVEGAEWPVLRHILRSPAIYRKIKQLAVELHTPRYSRTGEKMSVMDHAEVYASLEDLELEAGYEKFAHRTNNGCCGRFSTLTSTAANGGKRLCCYEQFYVNRRFDAEW